MFDNGESFTAGRVLDVSETGLFLETSEPQPRGSILTLFPVDREASDMFELEAEVVRVVPDDPDTDSLGGMGLRFLKPDEVRSQIDALIDALTARDANGVRDPLLGVRVPRSSPAAEPED